MPESARKLLRLILLVGVPVAAFLLAVTFSVTLSRDEETPAETSTPVVAMPGPTATLVPPTPTPVPTAVPPAHRIDCATIRGTPYRSDDERSWYLANCR